MRRGSAGAAMALAWGQPAARWSTLVVGLALLLACAQSRRPAPLERGAFADIARQAPSQLKPPLQPQPATITAPATRPADSKANPAVDVGAARPPAQLPTALARWDAATNAGDAAALKALYARSVGYYARQLPASGAISRKLRYRQRQRGFAQRLGAVKWQPRSDRWLASFDKTSTHEGAEPQSVQAYVLWRKLEGEWKIVEEGDRQTDVQLAALRDTELRAWRSGNWDCPACFGEDADEVPTAFAPLGPSPLSLSAKAPPGAPSRVAFARVVLGRFGSAVDVPMFFAATPRSTNGDGRWFYVRRPEAEIAAGAEDDDELNLITCALGGSFHYDDVPSAQDPGHTTPPQITFDEKFGRQSAGLYYERNIYSAKENIINFVSCSFDPQYEAYFTPIVRRMGHSLRALSGGLYERPARISAPYVSPNSLR